MAFIRNEVEGKIVKKPPRKDDDETRVIAKTPIELQRLKLQKLLKDPTKPAPIPERPKDRVVSNAPEFVRNVMGSSAGAGSGEFHVYRHLRRKEYARQKCIQEQAAREAKEQAYHDRIEENKKAAEEKTAKKRAKRQKQKEKIKKARLEKKLNKGKEPEKKEEEKEEESGTDEDSEASDSN